MQTENPSTTKGKIVLVTFPFDDLTSTKLRPAVCLTNKIGPYNHIVLAFITSQIPNDCYDSDIIIRVTNKDFDKTGLRVTSTIRLHRLMTVSTSIIKRELGRLPNTMQIKINKKLKKLFEL